MDGDFHKTGTIPDAKFIRSHVPVKEVAECLGLEPEPKGKRCRCPLDRGHFARLWLKKNWVLCSKCRTPKGTGTYWSPIDLVMEVKRLDVKDAIGWIAEHWIVPTCKMVLTTNKHGREKHLFVAYKPKPLPNALKPSLELLGRAAGWTKLSPSTRALAAVILQKVAHGDAHVWTGTQEELRKVAGIKSRQTMLDAMNQLRGIGLISTQREAAPDNYRTPNRNFTTRMVLRLDWASDQFQAWLGGREKAYLTPQHLATEYRCSELGQREYTELDSEDTQIWTPEIQQTGPPSSRA